MLEAQLLETPELTLTLKAVPFGLRKVVQTTVLVRFDHLDRDRAALQFHIADKEVKPVLTLCQRD